MKKETRMSERGRRRGVESEPLPNHVVVTLPSFGLCVSCSYCVGVRNHQGFELWAARRHIYTRSKSCKSIRIETYSIQTHRGLAGRKTFAESVTYSSRNSECEKSKAHRNFLYLACSAVKIVFTSLISSNHLRIKSSIFCTRIIST